MGVPARVVRAVPATTCWSTGGRVAPRPATRPDHAGRSARRAVPRAPATAGRGLTPAPLGGEAPGVRPASTRAAAAAAATPSGHEPAAARTGGSAGAAPRRRSRRWVLSGWWRRVGAALLDGLIVGTGAVAAGRDHRAVLDRRSSRATGRDRLGHRRPALRDPLRRRSWRCSTPPAMMARTNGKTLGRMAAGIRVVRANGQPMTFGFALLREVVSQGARVLDPRRSSPTCSTCCGRCGTRRTARSTTGS